VSIEGNQTEDYPDGGVFSVSNLAIARCSVAELESAFEGIEEKYLQASGVRGDGINCELDPRKHD
jgi:hypothetical protein